VRAVGRLLVDQIRHREARADALPQVAPGGIAVCTAACSPAGSAAGAVSEGDAASAPGAPAAAGDAGPGAGVPAAGETASGAAALVAGAGVGFAAAGEATGVADCAADGSCVPVTVGAGCAVAVGTLEAGAVESGAEGRPLHWPRHSTRKNCAPEPAGPAAESAPQALPARHSATAHRFANRRRAILYGPRWAEINRISVQCMCPLTGAQHLGSGELPAISLVQAA